ncbi:MAG TPA: universal stress protein [Vicinamibacterales bacterium]|nr:universal stress protein [Vicinamibacterales bacterium]
MITIDRILCPVDLSDCSRHGFDHAAAIARWYGASITLLHVFETVPVAAYATGAGSPGAVLTPPERAYVLFELERMAAAERRDGVAITFRRMEGQPYAEILNAAMEIKADLLVIGTHGRSGFQRLVLGSVTEKVLRRALCPVLAVPPRASGAPAPVAYKRILCPVDFSDSSLSALQYAMSLAEEANATVTVLHVVEYGMHEWPEIYDEFLSNQQLSLQDFRTRCRESSRERLELAVPEEARTWCTVESVLSEGKPYREIIRAAAEHHCDLIVMGVRGRNALDLALFGSTTQQVVRLATAPVLTIRDSQA